MQINHPGHLNWRLTGFDGYLEQDKDKDSWDLLCYLTQDTLFPWLIIRDFSNLLSSNDMTGFVVHPNWLMQGFHHTLLDCNLIGLPMECYQYTWARWHGQFHAIKEKLDRGLTIVEWIDQFPNLSMASLPNHITHQLSFI